MTRLLHFAQDEISYQGYEEGLGAFVPFAPHVVFQRRFGDCKDKTFLLHALLKLLKIDSFIVLVRDGSNNKKLNEGLPSPFAFNHVILQIRLGDVIFWVDPTIVLQGGSLEDSFIHEYHWGLLISENTSNLIVLPETSIKMPTTIHSQFEILSKEEACLASSIIYHGSSADFYRRYFSSNGTQTIAKERMDITQRKYPGSTVIKPLTISDDRMKNILTITEEYQIPLQKDEKDKLLVVHSRALNDYFVVDIPPERMTPYYFPYPLWVKEHIVITYPLIRWDVMDKTCSHSHEAFALSHSVRIEEQRGELTYELKHLKDHLQVDEISSYKDLIKSIEPIVSYELLVFTPSDNEIKTKKRLGCMQIFWIVFGIISLLRLLLHSK